MSLEGPSLQYGSATGSTWQVIPLHGSVPSGGYFLVGLAVTLGGPAGVNLPQVDQKVGINISAFSGKVALVYGTTPLSGCPSSAADGGSTPLIDFVGYGSANCSEAR